jgi:hypothetical protein
VQRKYRIAADTTFIPRRLKAVCAIDIPATLELREGMPYNAHLLFQEESTELLHKGNASMNLRCSILPSSNFNTTYSLYYPTHFSTCRPVPRSAISISAPRLFALASSVVGQDNSPSRIASPRRSPRRSPRCPSADPVSNQTYQTRILHQQVPSSPRRVGGPLVSPQRCTITSQPAASS